jgi:hypothetical protein
MSTSSDADADSLRCPALTRGGQRCRGHPLPTTGLCFAHSPQSGVWRAQGGHATSRAAKAERLLPSRLRPVVEGLERAFAAVEAEQMDARTGTALATIAAAIVRTVQAGELEERLRSLEQQAHADRLDRDCLGRLRKDGYIEWERRVD